MVKNKSVLITGGAGFIGSYLCEKLVARGDKVFVLDNLSTGRKENIRHLLGNKNFVLKIGDVLNKSLVKKMVQGTDEIYHLAAAVGVKTVMEKPLDSWLLNIRGTENILDAALEKKIPVLITSTSEIYGKSTKIPFKEEDDRTYGSIYNYRWGYAFSKGADEFLALAYWRENGLPTRIVRLFNTIGPRQSGEYGMVVPRFIKQAMAGENITIYGNGEQTRSFGYVGDVVGGIVKIMENSKSNGGVYNLGSDEEISIKNLAKKIIKTTNSPSQLAFIPHSKVYADGFEDMARRKPDISKARKLVGFTPKTSLDEIIKKIIAYEKRR